MKTSSEDSQLPLPPALLAEVRAAAEEQHRLPNEIVYEAVVLYLKVRRDAKAPATSAAERARAFEAWARSHPYTPPLSDEAIGRENLVRDAQ